MAAGQVDFQSHGSSLDVVVVVLAAAAEDYVVGCDDDEGRDRAGVEVAAPFLTNVESPQKSDESHKRLSLNGSIEPELSWRATTDLHHSPAFVFLFDVLARAVAPSGPGLDRGPSPELRRL